MLHSDGPRKKKDLESSMSDIFLRKQDGWDILWSKSLGR